MNRYYFIGYFSRVKVEVIADNEEDATNRAWRLTDEPSLYKIEEIIKKVEE
jgi:hypothetical protein